jgi:hypothetical protein
MINTWSANSNKAVPVTSFFYKQLLQINNQYKKEGKIASERIIVRKRMAGLLSYVKIGHLIDRAY